MDEVTPLLWLAAACVRTELGYGWDDTAGLDDEALLLLLNGVELDAAGLVDYYG